jgi:hypothetical protein
MGYDPILHETGDIPYGSSLPLEDYCYDEVTNCDILVSIIGGRFGSESQKNSDSISQNELKLALKAGKQVYIFIDKNVSGEYKTYLKNKDNLKIKYHYVDNQKIYQFIEEINQLSHNNATFNFETSDEIIEYLKSQWSGLFQRLLHDNEEKEEIKIIDKLNDSAESLNKMLNYVIESNKDKDQALRSLLTENHPAFIRIKTLLQIPFRIYFTNLDELVSLLEDRSFTDVIEENWDNPDIMEWRKTVKVEIPKDELLLLKISKKLFKNGKLIMINDSDWDDNLITTSKFMVTHGD